MSIQLEGTFDLEDLENEQTLLALDYKRLVSILPESFVHLKYWYGPAASAVAAGLFTEVRDDLKIRESPRDRIYN